MTILNDSKRANVFIAIIDKKGIESKRTRKQYELVNALGKPMYAIIKKDVDWSTIKHLPWRKVYLFEYESEIPHFMQLISVEVAGGGYYT